MELSWLYTILALLVATLIFLIKNKKGQATEEVQQRAGPRGPIEAHGGARRPVRRLNRHGQRGNQNEEVENIQASDEDEEDDSSPTLNIDRSKIGTKKLRKLEEKEQRRIQREMEAREREEDKQRKEELDEIKRKKEADEEAAEEARLLEEQKAEEERLERERIEYEKVKADFEIEDEGEDATTEEDEQNLLKMFLDYIKENKVCYVDALASEFGLRNPDAVKRINSLMESGDLTGVLDDRGKFIYITMDELSSVAKWINLKGRVSLEEIQRESNKLIKL